MNDYENVSLTDAELNMILAEYQRKQLIENLTGPGISLVAHIVLLMLGFLFIVTTDRTQPSLVVETVVVEEIELEEEIIEDIKEDEMVDEDAPIEELNSPSTDIGEITSPVDVSDEAPMTDDQTEMEEVLDIVKNKSILSYVGPIGGRSDAGRKTAIGKYGDGNSRIGQDRLNRALRWLASVQNANGSWGVGNGFAPESGHPAHTGLALLVFLAHGDTPLSEKYGKTVQNAMRWLGEYGNQSDINVKRKPMGYAHGIATYAIAESYAMTKIPFMQTAMENCIDKVIDGQMGNGGFGYAYTSGSRWDMSVAGWNFQALKAAKMAGSTNEKLSSAIRKSINFCKSVAYNGQGNFGYASENGGKGVSKPNMGGIGVVALQLLGDAESPQVREGCERIGNERILEYEKVMSDPSKWSSIGSNCLYGWYYDTQAIFNSQNLDKARWKRWRKAFETVLIGSQKDEGYWETNSHGTGPTTDGRILSTCWAALQLEVYYRYLPTFDKTQIDKFNESDGIENVGTGGMVIEIN